MPKNAKYLKTCSCSISYIDVTNDLLPIDIGFADERNRIDNASKPYGEKILGYDSTPRVTAANFLCQQSDSKRFSYSTKEYSLPVDLL